MEDYISIFCIFQMFADEVCGNKVIILHGDVLELTRTIMIYEDIDVSVLVMFHLSLWWFSKMFSKYLICIYIYICMYSHWFLLFLMALCHLVFRVICASVQAFLYSFYLYIYIYIYVYVNKKKGIYIYICIYVYIYICIYAYIYACH